jgi:hypothetical protein
MMVHDLEEEVLQLRIEVAELRKLKALDNGPGGGGDDEAGAGEGVEECAVVAVDKPGHRRPGLGNAIGGSFACYLGDDGPEKGDGQGGPGNAEAATRAQQEEGAEQSATI